MSEVEIDEQTRAALGRLTAGEKECLHRRLKHQTAKEMALDLGISPHAVEKRLKMARAKLGLSSSLEVARLLAASEGYQRTGAQAADLDPAQKSRNSWLTKPKLVGATAMIILGAAMLAFLAQGQSGGTIDNPAYDGTADNSGEHRSIQDLEFVKASPERVEAYVRQMFDNWDRDGSGYVEKAEAPEWLSVPKPGRLAPGESPEYIELEGDAARAQYIENVDKDDDGKVSYDEYAGPVRPQFLERGIPLIPADWTGAPVSREESAESEPADAEAMPPGHVAQSSGNLADVGAAPDNFRMLPASDFVDGTPEELRAFAEERFRTMDKDGSGFVERDEAPDVQIRMTDVEWEGDGTPPREWLEQQSRRVPLDPAMAKAVYIAKSDADGDGKLSYDEYLAFRNAGFDAKQVPVSWREQRQARR